MQAEGGSRATWQGRRSHGAVRVKPLIWFGVEQAGFARRNILSGWHCPLQMPARTWAATRHAVLGHVHKTRPPCWVVLPSGKRTGTTGAWAHIIRKAEPRSCVHSTKPLSRHTAHPRPWVTTTGRIGCRQQLAGNVWLVSLGCSGGAQRSCRVHLHINQLGSRGKPLF